MRLEPLALALALLAACRAEISDGAGASLATVDAAVGTPVGGNTGGGAGGSASPDAPAGCTSRTVYLNFEGQTLTRGPSDATLNQASWLVNPQGTAPAYLSGVANRTGVIQNIVSGIRTQLSQFPITVVTDRPASGEYVMIVFGGRASTISSRFSGAVNALDCGDVQHSDVAWISDGVSPVQAVVNVAIGAIGFGLGLTATTDQTDCMCGWDNTCQPDNSAPCKLGSPINRDPSANQTCAGLTTQDEVAALHDAFCR
ncbi:MAG TPA: hypothetical protein VFK02_21355 [Kofleriaceae bacterium]|nr:hypothetical protein [Kofleriaceae bacterium]